MGGHGEMPVGTDIRGAYLGVRRVGRDHVDARQRCRAYFASRRKIGSDERADPRNHRGLGESGEMGDRTTMVEYLECQSQRPFGELLCGRIRCGVPIGRRPCRAGPTGAADP